MSKWKVAGGRSILATLIYVDESGTNGDRWHEKM